MEYSTQYIATALLLFLVGFLGFVVYKMKTDDKHKGQDPGKVLIYYANKYLVTWLILLQGSALLAEAAMIGGAQDGRTNVASRMILHLVIAGGSILASFLWVRSLFQFVSVAISKRSLGEKSALCLIAFLIMLVTIVLSMSAPFYNMWALANAMNNTVQLELFGNYVQYKFGFMSQTSYFASIIEAHDGLNPGRYAAFANLHSAMVSSIGITVYHIGLTLWEVLFVLQVAITQKSMGNIMGEDLVDPGDAAAAAAATAAQTANTTNTSANSSSTPPNQATPQTQTIEKILKFCGVDDAKIPNWTQQVLKLFANRDTTETAKMTLTFQKFLLGVKQLEEPNRRKTSDNQTASELEDTIRKFVKDYSNNSLTLPARTAGNGN